MSFSSPRSTSYLTEESSYPAEQEHILVGKVLGNRYRVLRELGSGGMAWVYLAEDVNESKLVAIKILYPQFGEDLAYIQRFNREAKLASTLTDSHIVRVLDYGADRDIYYLVMDYVEGQDLRETLKEKGPFPWKDALDLIDQLATALEHAHQHGVVHRDIKPQNLMLDDGGLLKVLDFGIARVPTLPSLTQSGFIGSPYYVSPEQAMGEEVDIRSDIYSSGIVLYELLSGSIPFDAKSPWSIISQHISSEPPPIDLPDGDAPETLQTLLERMVAKRPEDRFQTPTAIRRAIAAILAGQPIPDNALDTRPITPPDRIEIAESLYQRALEATDSKEWARAADFLSQVLNLNPNHSEAAQKLPKAEEEAFIVSVFNAARRAVNDKCWEEAIDDLNGILKIDPDHNEAKELLAEARRALEKENAQQFILTRYNEGLAHFDAADWENAIVAFEEVQHLSPGFKQVEKLLADAKQFSNPTLPQKLSRVFSKDSVWRWALVAVGVLVIFVAFLTFSNGSQVTGDDDTRQQLKALYTEAQLAIENHDTEQAVALLGQILEQDPDYADAATLRRDLIAALTPTPTSTPTATPVPTPTLSPTPQEDPLVTLINEAEDAIELEQWSGVIEALQKIRAANPEFETARVTSLFCDAYVGRGLETLASIRRQDNNQKEIMSTALADFEAGAAECPKRIDLQDQAERAAAYLEALNTSSDDYETLIQILTPIVAAESNYADSNARNLLYNAHLHRGDARRESADIVGALSDYETALALNVNDPSEAQTRRAELLLAFSQQPVLPTPEPIETSESGEVGTASNEPTPAPVRIRLDQPKLVGPENDAAFAGEFFQEVYLEWEPVKGLAADEYYDLTIMYIFADAPTYWGLATKETRIHLTSSDIELGKAGGNRFYWWVTVRKANSALTADTIDLPVSPQSEVRTFVWTP